MVCNVLQMVFNYSLKSNIISQESFNKYLDSSVKIIFKLQIHHWTHSILYLFGQRELKTHTMCYCATAWSYDCYVWQIHWTKIEDIIDDSEHKHSEIYIQLKWTSKWILYILIEWSRFGKWFLILSLYCNTKL